MGGVRFKADPEEENFTEKHADPTGAGYATLKGAGCNICNMGAYMLPVVGS